MRANPRLKKIFLSEYSAKTLKTESLSGVKNSLYEARVRSELGQERDSTCHDVHVRANPRLQKKFFFAAQEVLDVRGEFNVKKITTKRTRSRVRREHRTAMCVSSG